MKSNRRYSSYSSSASSQKKRVKENPFLLCSAAIIAVLVACMSGRSMDQKLVSDKVELTEENQSERAGLKRESVVGDAQEAYISKLSQAPRGPHFSPDRWSPTALYFTDDNGVQSNDVSSLISNSFSLTRSLRPGFQLQKINLVANFKSDRSFLELESSDGRLNKLLVTVVGRNINVTYRGLNGELKRIASFVWPQDECQELSISYAGEREITCLQSKVNLGKIPHLPIAPATLAVRSHLSETELSALKVTGSYRGAVTEDSL